jgi:hypothetical protein
MLGAALLVGCLPAAPPNVSSATLPVGYYGSSYITKTAVVYDMLSRQRVVVLMQQDGDEPAGHCWLECCPEKDWDPVGRCQGGGGTSRAVPLNASLNPGCNPGCDQHGKQVREFGIIKRTARQAGRPLPHAVLYMNSVYDWPFDAAHGKGAHNIDVLDIHGNPHAEQCDPGIYPSFFLDHGRPAGQAAFLDTFKKYVQGGDTADGVYLDCFDQMPLSCKGGGPCKAIRNKKGNNASIVSRATVTNYISGKKAGMSAATKLVAQQSGGIFTAKTWDVQKSHDPYGANTAIRDAKDPIQMAAMVDTLMRKNGYKYILIGGGYSNLRRDPTDVASVCSGYEVAKFLLGFEPGCFLICQGWAHDFEKALGDPLGPATWQGGQVFFRAFASGTNVSWTNGTQQFEIQWSDGTTSGPDAPADNASPVRIPN